MTLNNENIKPNNNHEKNISSKKRKYSTSSIMVWMFAIALFLLFYISNIIRVNELLSETSALNSDLKKINNNNILQKVTIAKLTSYDRITLIAETQLGLVHPKEAPQWFEVKK